jgi:hypothetical protein
MISILCDFDLKDQAIECDTDLVHKSYICHTQYPGPKIIKPRLKTSLKSQAGEWLKWRHYGLTLTF